jgi:Asp-tRNA(Asn)/Glu-tRNA(Gln) amidotransferase A subunit family amidase
MQVDGATVNASSHLGVFAQPLSFAGLLVLAAPVAGAGALPLGVQIVAAPCREDLVLRVAAAAERLGALAVPPLATDTGSPRCWSSIFPR